MQVERRVDLHRAALEQLARDLLVQQQLAEAVDAHGQCDRPRAVQQPRDAGPQRRSLPRRAGGEVQEPAVADRLLDALDAVEVHRPLHVLASLAEAAPEGDPARERHQLREQVLLHRLLGGGEAQHGLLERELVPHVDEVEEGDRLEEVGLVVREEHHVAPRQVRQDLVALDVHVVEDREVGDREADTEARQDAAADPAVEEGAGRLPLREHAAEQADARDRPDRSDQLAREPAWTHACPCSRGGGDLTLRAAARHAAVGLAGHVSHCLPLPVRGRVYAPPGPLQAPRRER